MKASVDTLISKVKDGSLDPTQIPISQSDYDAFLPSLGSGSAGPGGLLFNNGYSTLSSLFNSYQLGDLSGAQLAETLFNTYGDNLVNGLSYNVSLSYTSPNETTKEMAKALYRGEFQDTIDGFEEGFADTAETVCKKTLESCQSACGDTTSSGFDACFQKCSTDFTTCSRAATGTDTSKSTSLSLNTIRSMMNTAKAPTEPKYQSWMDSVFSSDKPDRPNKKTAGFNWKDKCSQLYSALKRMSLDPGDFGCLEPNAQVSPDYSWRGNAKMICTRAATHYDPALPEQIGCPPVGWKGWRS